nr:MAG TPA: hypothetical protein [Caudoviricetes sp.]
MTAHRLSKASYEQSKLSKPTSSSELSKNIYYKINFQNKKLSTSYLLNHILQTKKYKKITSLIGVGKLLT